MLIHPTLVVSTFYILSVISRIECSKIGFRWVKSVDSLIDRNYDSKYRAVRKRRAIKTSLALF